MKGIPVTARGMAADAGTGGGSGMGGGMGGSMPAPAAPAQAAPVQIPLAAVTDIRVVEGPSIIKSENGLLRSIIQLRVSDRSEVGLAEEAQRVVRAAVIQPRHTWVWSL